MAKVWVYFGKWNDLSFFHLLSSNLKENNKEAMKAQM
jgi:hypothetical protein